MPTLTIPDVSPQTYAHLEERATAAGRTVEDEARAVIEDWAFRPGNDDTGPLDYERPITGRRVKARFGGVRLPVPPPNLDTTPE